VFWTDDLSNFPIAAQLYGPLSFSVTLGNVKVVYVPLLLIILSGSVYPCLIHWNDALGVPWDIILQTRVTFDPTDVT